MTEMEKLNRFTRREHAPEEVYLFDVILCDNEIDRDKERFSEKALMQMQPLFLGKTGIFDHDLRSRGQTARIYDTELVQEAGKLTSDGRPYMALRAKAYMIRTDSNADLIREIDGGIKKEVSVSCCAAKRICSVCGADRSEGLCQHVPGRRYGDTVCCVILDEIQDAYEWSFVAVPAQVGAGVTKTCGKETGQMETQELLLGEVENMLRAEVLTLCGKEGKVSKALAMAAEKMGLQDLMRLRRMLLTEQSGQVQLAGETDSTPLDAFVQRSREG